jgi:hypothetical protein
MALAMAVVAIGAAGCARSDNGPIVASMGTDGYGSSAPPSLLPYYDVTDPYHIDRASARQNF